MQIRDGQIWSLEEEGTFALVKGRHLSVRARTLGDCANPTALENEAEYQSSSLTLSAVTGSTMEAEPFTAAHEVTRISSNKLHVALA